MNWHAGLRMVLLVVAAAVVGGCADAAYHNANDHGQYSEKLKGQANKYFQDGQFKKAADTYLAG